ncbi:MAG: aspartate/glutamate racemase family protein [Roseomonas sp.]|nr:aspartate/glutamate racemase family protein [Roseomonas sp.]MCA3327886.1 aspartate/glutamate racemase family protein [Roseomonas sp.]MCA3331678.1 aspartate/glutamate racemase family protein [Roseomonas sp.]MCA3333255.1 aspartate/glutamate racemase family protein [Roseomonas sp.]MCA3348047.1 aspartate/glutamate racemase family protein [Roseomonas sp.]
MIDYGTRARLGLMVPSGNAICEAELHAMLPEGVVALITRLELRGSSEAELSKMLDRLEDAAGLLADARPGLIGFHCTAVSTFAPERAAEIPARMMKATGLPAVTTADAILAALQALGARRLLLVTPYIAAVHEREIAFLAAHGCAVIGGDMMGINTNAEMAQIPPKAIADQARRAAHAYPGADALFISCTAIRSAGLIAPLESELGLPVITSNQVMAWHALRCLGMKAARPGFGRLMALS